MEKYELNKVKIVSSPILQANNGNTIFELLQWLKNSPMNRKEVGTVVGKDKRNISYYIDALGAMGLLGQFKYGNEITYVISNDKWPLVNKIKTEKDFAHFLISIDFIKDEKTRLASSTHAKTTIARRASAIRSITKWIKEKK